MNLYMKYLMSRVPVAHGLRGLPASFLVTGLQQMTALLLFLTLRVAAGTLRASPQLRRLDGSDRLWICCLAVAFSMNMGLNNFSLAFIPLSVNQVIRACMPLATAMLQVGTGALGEVSAAEWACMVSGVVCAGLTVVARTEGHLASSSTFLFGALLCVGSVFCGAADLVMKQRMGTEMRLSPIDAMGLMALPSFLFLLVPGLLWHHPVPDLWAKQLGKAPGGIGWTDASVLLRAFSLNGSLAGFVALSGLLAFGYNVFTTFFASRLSATTVSLVGNFPTSTLISLLILERRVLQGWWAVLLWASVLGNIAAFTVYSSARRRRLARKI